MLDNLTHLEKSGEPVIIIDSNGSIQWKNEAASPLFPEDYQLSERLELATYRQLLAKQGSFLIKLRLLPTKQLPEVHYHAAVLDISSLDPDSELKLVYLTIHPVESPDITEREEFLSTIAHDLKNPLGAIFGYSDVLLDTDLGSGLNLKQEEIIVRIRSTAARLVELVRNYQHLSVLRLRGELALPSEGSELNRIIQSVLDSTWRESPAPSIILNLSTEQLPVKIDTLSVERIIANLLTNALKYCGDQGVIKIRSERIQDHARFTISNSGAPIPKPELETLFKRYKRGSNSKDIAGTGLGLYIVKQIADLFHAPITVTSEKDQGTTFTIDFPSKFNE